MAKMNRVQKLEDLAKRTARLKKMAERYQERIGVVEREMVSSVASGVAPVELQAQLKTLRRRSRGPRQQLASMLDRLEAKGGADLVEKYMTVKQKRKKTK